MTGHSFGLFIRSIGQGSGSRLVGVPRIGWLVGREVGLLLVCCELVGQSARYTPPTPTTPAHTAPIRTDTAPIRYRYGLDPADAVSR